MVIARSVGTFARALDCTSTVRQPSLHMSAAAASRVASNPWYCSTLVSLGLQHSDPRRQSLQYNPAWLNEVSWCSSNNHDRSSEDLFHEMYDWYLVSISTTSRKGVTLTHTTLQERGLDWQKEYQLLWSGQTPDQALYTPSSSCHSVIQIWRQLILGYIHLSYS